MLRFFRYAIEFVAAFAAFVILLAALLAWRLSEKPISSDYLTPYVNSAIESLLPGSDVHAGSSLLTWDNVDHSVAVHVANIRLDDAGGVEIGTIETVDAKASLLGIIFGQFLPKTLSIQRPQLKLERNKEGAFVFGGMSLGGDASVDKHPRPLNDTLKKLVDHLSHATLMSRLGVTDAVFDVHDDQTNQNWAVSVPEISIARTALKEVDHTLKYGALEGVLTLEVTQKENTAKLEILYAYDPTKTVHSISTSLDGLIPAYLAGGHPETLGLTAASQLNLPLTGKIEMTFDKNFQVLDGDLKIHGDEGHIVYTDFWDQPLAVKSFDLQASYDKAASKLTISDTHADLNGIKLDLSMAGVPSKHAGQDMDFTLNLAIDNMPMNDYGTLWPKSIVANARYWLAANMRDGTFTHASVALNGYFALNKLDDLTIAEGSGKLSAVNGTVTYLDGMPPVTGVSADGTFDLKGLSVHVTSGGIGDIRLLPFTIDITGLAEEDQHIHIPLQVKGPVPQVMQLLDHKPLGYAKKLGLSPDDIQGDIQGSVDFKFPLLRTLEMKDVSINATADANGIASTKLIPGVSVDQGDISLSLDMQGFSLKGVANLDKVPFQITWQQVFAAQAGKPLQEATINGVVRDDQWKDLGLNVFTGTKGPVNLSFQMTRTTKTRTQFSGSLDMGAASMELDLLGWKKPANIPATLEFAATANAGKPVEITSIQMKGESLAGTGSATLSSDMTQILSVNMSQITIGRTNTAVHFNQSFGEEGSLSFEATGKSIDISGLRDSQSTISPDPRPQHYQVKVDRLYTGVDGEIDMAQGHASRDAQGWSEIDLKGIVGAKVGEGKPLTFELSAAVDGHRNLAISSDDFGEAMKGLGFTDTIKGGKLSVSGVSTVEHPRQIEGTAKITAFTVEHLPVLALLLNAMSPFGFSGILTDSADFSRFEGDFRWEGDELTLTRAHAAGSAVGINIDGKINLGSGDANLQGTVVPFSVMNNILNYIPILGNLITGGDNQGVLAVAYHINGSLSKPEVHVNPISLLTPGFIRNLFFRDNTMDDDKSTDKQPDKPLETAPEPAATAPTGDAPVDGASNNPDAITSQTP